MEILEHTSTGELKTLVDDRGHPVGKRVRLYGDRIGTVVLPPPGMKELYPQAWWVKLDCEELPRAMHPDNLTDEWYKKIKQEKGN